MPKKHPAPDARQALLQQARSLKMARSAHAYVRGNTLKFYEWLEANAPGRLPEGPPVWICGDCHVGNLGPVADVHGGVEIQIRDFDQTVVGNPAHDLVRLGLSLAMAVRSSDLPGVTTALMIEQLMAGYIRAFAPGDAELPEHRPAAVHIALKAATRRTWRHLAKERLQGQTVELPRGRRFWPVTRQEHETAKALCESEAMRSLVTAIRGREDDEPVRFLDVAYWKKGCSSLGKLRYAAVLDVGGRGRRGRDLCLIDIKEAALAAAPRHAQAEMPHEYAQRVLVGAQHLSPHVGNRMIAARMLDRSVFARELLPEDLKLEIEHIGPEEAKHTASYLAHVLGRAHARQLDQPARDAWIRELARGQTRSLEAPSWLWNSVVELVAFHEQGYLEHCRRYALASAREIEAVQAQPA